MTITSRSEPSAVYGLHHPEFGAVKVGVCIEPRERRIGQFTRKGWTLISAYGTPTATDAEQIEQAVMDAVAQRIWWGWRYDQAGLPWHHRNGSRCDHCGRGGEPGQPFLQRVGGGFLSRQQVPQGGAGETFDARLVPPERLRVVLFYAEQQHRAEYYPPRPDGLDPEGVRRERLAAYWSRRYAEQIRRC
ncbi:hypothetical protein ABTY61_22865 [Kitasatospora sp. NPDC096128]|uniref:hypothetical protein n=1 Tax=Kitasatospora sp. NPDC096128 TaxID=3155547 RepID=UPI003320FC42